MTLFLFQFSQKYKDNGDKIKLNDQNVGAKQTGMHPIIVHTDVETPTPARQVTIAGGNTNPKHPGARTNPPPNPAAERQATQAAGPD